jgi:hypothetical protein
MLLVLVCLCNICQLRHDRVVRVNADESIRQLAQLLLAGFSKFGNHPSLECTSTDANCSSTPTNDKTLPTADELIQTSMIEWSVWGKSGWSMN